MKIHTLLVSSAMMIGLTNAATAQDISLRYAHVGTEGDIQYRYVAEVAAAIAERSEGRIALQVFPASQLGGVAEMVDGVRSGAIDMAHHDFASLARIVPEVAVFSARQWPRTSTRLGAAVPPPPALAAHLNGRRPPTPCR